jgi:hypothetical protein
VVHKAVTMSRILCLTVVSLVSEFWQLIVTGTSLDRHVVPYLVLIKLAECLLTAILERRHRVQH